MQHSKTNLLFVLILTFLSIQTLHAQEAIPASGGEATGIGGTASFSIGQTAYITIDNSNGMVAQGVQHPFEIWIISGIEEAKGIQVTCSAYPNPTSNIITLKVENYNIANLAYQLYDMNGKFLENKEITDMETHIILSDHAKGIYFLKVTDLQKEVKTFKILKK